MTRASARAPLLVFVCSGNICRSPMAEGIAADEAAKTGLLLRVASAGTAALEGYGAHESAIAVLESEGIDLSAHRAQQITRALVEDAVLVVTATRRQRDEVRALAPESAEIVVSFADATDLGDLADPFGRGDEAFEATAKALRAGMPRIFALLRGRA